MADRGWKRAFDDPIPRPHGRQLVTLEDAAKYIQKLPKAEQRLAEWQAAVEALLLVVEHNGPTMMARKGVMLALNRHHVREFNPKTSEGPMTLAASAKTKLSGGEGPSSRRKSVSRDGVSPLDRRNHFSSHKHQRS
jgi:hypothetical protein